MAEKLQGSEERSSWKYNNPTTSKLVVLADLNVDPPEAEPDDDDSSLLPPPHIQITRLINDENSQDKSLLSKDTDSIEGEGKKFNKLGKCRSKPSKTDSSIDCGADADGDQHVQLQGAPSSREEKVSSMKTGLVHVARKMPKNAHAHFILGLMYQRLNQPQKAILSYEKAEEILLRPEVEIDRAEFLSLVQIHHAQCLIIESSSENNSDKELESHELEEIISKLKESMQSDIRQAAVWNTLGFILLKTGRVQSAISVLSSLLAIAPENYDCLGNLGIAYLQIGNLESSAKCFQELILKDQNHPAALVNYAALLLCKYASVVAGAGANAAEGALAEQSKAANVAKECLLAAIKADGKSAHIWANLAYAFSISGDHRSSSRCLEKAAKLEPNCMSTRYAVASHRVKEAERCQDPSELLSCAGNEMASIIRDGDSSLVELPIAWSGLAMVHKAQHEISAAYESEQHGLAEIEERAVSSLKQAISEDPDDVVQWHQLGLHSLCARQFKTSQKYLKAAVACDKRCSYAWSNLGVSLQLSEEQSHAEEVYKRALSLATTQEAHTILSNMGILYRHQKKYQLAKAMFTKSLELQPGYAPAFNNLGLVFVAEGLLEEAKYCFEKALESDQLLDAAKSNLIKVATMSNICKGLSSCSLKE
ncbi:putative UDP-N-acetylglucosamine-peptide N-acetylglucosaminyltransferase SPINDLY-like protein [Trifolium pratense]|uniref:Putative UDP-N-acetylglucosamine-peptide N-acetylglucosaminyltransferase SPINDLY-like protein n=1 Tax=Trifolium pratense TaxID=57577 RepID=A0A2K3NLR4_TRIPR|nr:probable UDP-N-acetylglucosamine--peptide N-acetylglucosaminyltransferase SPINDLY [Trifolium pratense]PNY03939.1 putative UDP-N-acetylglucosamine-peptide N-acetylglucosaminyltransferase SPINDLY-like protein [Trifolium pratense]